MNEIQRPESMGRSGDYASYEPYDGEAWFVALQERARDVGFDAFQSLLAATYVVIMATYVAIQNEEELRKIWLKLGRQKFEQYATILDPSWPVAGAIADFIITQRAQEDSVERLPLSDG